MGFENTGRVWTVESLREYLGEISKPSWCDSVTLHHTAAPSLAQRPNGFTAQHIKNIEHFYRVTKGWSSGPHLFVDEDQLWGMCDFRRKGVHAESFNGRSIGIEVLGDYDVEAPGSGRGLACWRMAAAATQVILAWLGKKPGDKTVFFHRDDPLTSKSCPGTKVKKDWVMSLLKAGQMETAAETPARPSRPAKLAKANVKFDGVHWSTPVRDYLLQKGLGEDDIQKALKKKGKYYYLGNELLEDAYIDPSTGMAWTSVRELQDVRLPVASRKGA